MRTPLDTLGNLFYGAAAVLGLPSLLGSIFFGWAAISLWFFSSVPSGAPHSRDQMVRIIEGIGDVVGAFARFFGGAVQLVTTILAAISLVVLVVAAVLFVTGRGLHAGQAWARIVAGILAVGFLSLSTLLFLSVRGLVPHAATGAVLAGSVYTLWTLWKA